MSKKRAAVYGRASRGKGGRSVRDQMTENRRTCVLNDWEIAWEFQETERSASRYARRLREEYQAVLSLVETGLPDVLVTWESSRAQRDLAAYVRLRDLCMSTNTLWCYNGRVYDLSRRDDRFRTGMDALRDEDEAEIIRERNLRTVRLNAERGWPHGKLSYGFRREYHPSSGVLLGQFEDPVTADIVREITRRIAAEQSCTSIAADLTRRGIPTHHGAKAWSRTVVREITLNPGNIGRRVYRGADIGPAAWSGIVDPGDFYAAAAVLLRPERKTTRERAVKHLLSGQPTCGVEGCGEPYISVTMKGYSCYRCRAFHSSILKTRLEAYVEEAVLQWLERVDIAALMATRTHDGGVEQALLEAERAEAQLLEARTTAGLPGGLSVASLTALENNLLPLIKDAHKRARDSVFPPAVAEMAGPDVRLKWAAADTDVLKKRAVLRSVVRIVVNPGGRGVRTIRPGRVVLTWPLDEVAPDAS